MRGLGFLIWQLANMPPPQELARILAGRVNWVSIKTLHAGELYNAKAGNQKLLKTYWAVLQQAGLNVGAWHYVTGEQPGLEGDNAAAFIDEFNNDGLVCDHLLIDAEKEYKRYGATKAAKIYCDKLPKKTPVYLCSYRFPSQHKGAKPFPFSAFINHPIVTGATPQVYWIGAHNPAQQTQQSYDEYKGLSSKPFIPIGASFGETYITDNKKVYWEPTPGDLAEFRDWNERIYPAYGYYSLDYILTHNRLDWLSVITDSAPPAPPPADLTDHEKITRLWEYGQAQGWDA